MLKSYKVTSIRKKSGMVIFGSPQTVVDEGDIFRIAELHVISVDNSSKWYKFFHFKIGQLSKVNTLSQQTKLKNLK